MSKQPRLDVLELKRLLQKRIVEQIDLPDRQVVRRMPPGSGRSSQRSAELHSSRAATGEEQSQKQNLTPF